MGAVLTDSELATLLKLELPLVARLIEESDLPRVTIAGQVRFITADVLRWLSAQETLLAPVELNDTDPHNAQEPPAEGLRSEADTVVLPAEPDEAPFVTRQALSALGRHAADPDYNLMRQQVRDGVAALGDLLHPTLIQLSGDRLHTAPKEADRTSAWRLEEDMECIDHIMMTWAEGEGPPGFDDRPRLTLSVTSDAVEFSVQVPETWRGAPPDSAMLTRARASGAMIARSPQSQAWSVTYLYDVARGAPTVGSLGAQLARDAKTLVPLWSSAQQGERQT